MRHFSFMFRDITIAARLAIGIIFTRAAFTKATGLREFASGIAGYGIVPTRLTIPAAYFVIAAEAFVALTHLTGIAMPPAAWFCLTMLGAFFVASIVGLRRGVPILCHCGVDDATQHLSRLTLLRIGVLFCIDWLVLISTTAGRQPSGVGEWLNDVALSLGVVEVLAWAMKGDDVWRLHGAAWVLCRDRILRCISGDLTGKAGASA
jgi:hypothetical protein